jgi:hypothetical protein
MMVFRSSSGLRNQYQVPPGSPTHWCSMTQPGPAQALQPGLLHDWHENQELKNPAREDRGRRKNVEAIITSNVRHPPAP